jgi:hypothetical protein
MAQTPWAILLCKFKDNVSAEPFTRHRFEELFTSSGAGNFNMLDFFQDMSHGLLDLSGSQVFGWFTLDKNSSDYTGSGANQQGRTDLITWARQAAIDDDVDLSKFFSVVVFMNVSTDLFGGPNGVGLHPDQAGNGMSSLSPSIVGQEMGHTYGLLHSRDTATGTDYQDRWDVMSTGRFPTMAAHPSFTDVDMRGRPLFRIGPGLNAANMWGRGWLDSSRVWTAGDLEYGETVQLRPLHRRDLPGYLAARVGEYFFELRVPDRWDAAIGPAVVLVHHFHSGASYIDTGNSGNQGLSAGDKFQQGDAANPLAPLLQVEVTNIDSAAQTGTLRVTKRVDRRPHAGPAGPFFGGVTSGGGGFVLVGGKIVRVPPRTPSVLMLEDLAVFVESESISHGAARDLLQRNALQSLSARANVQLQRMLSYREPAPPQLEQPGDSDQVYDASGGSGGADT